jgi:hypothetical protein
VTDRTVSVVDPASIKAIPPPRRRHKNQSLHLNAAQAIRILSLLPLVLSVT